MDHPSYTRLLGELRRLAPHLDGPAAFAKFLTQEGLRTSEQTMWNWASRGVAKPAAMELGHILRIDPVWICYGARVTPATSVEAQGAAYGTVTDDERFILQAWRQASGEARQICMTWARTVLASAKRSA